jgi:hypothetical protein
MVKNTGGGNKSKSFARKHSSTSDSDLRLPISGEAIAIVTQVFGHGTAQVFFHDSFFVLHIRNKFKGKSKRLNLISRGSFVLIGFRHWESNSSNVDLLHVYDSIHISLLRKQFSFDFLSLDKAIHDSHSFTHDDSILFTQSSDHSSDHSNISIFNDMNPDGSMNSVMVELAIDDI